MNYKIIYNNNSLSHFGILGMKWGVRNEETKARYLRERRGKQQKKTTSVTDNATKKNSSKKKNSDEKAVAAVRIPKKYYPTKTEVDKYYKQIDTKYKNILDKETKQTRAIIEASLDKMPENYRDTIYNIAENIYNENNFGTNNEYFEANLAIFAAYKIFVDEMNK